MPRKYAPELNLRGAIATGVVTSFPLGPYPMKETGSGTGGPFRFTMLRLLGGSLPDDAQAADSLISDRGRMILHAARTSCIDDVRGIEQREKLTAETAFAIEPPRLEALLTPVTDMDPVRMTAPLFLGTGLPDRTLPPRRQYAAAAALCAAGNAVVWKTYPGITHNGIVNAAFDDELTFARRVRGGAPAESDCRTLVEPGAPGAPLPGIRYND